MQPLPDTSRLACAAEDAAEQEAQQTHGLHMDFAHAAALEQEQAEEELMHEDNDVVVRVTENGAEPGATAEGRSAGDKTAATEGTGQDVACAATSQVEGSGPDGATLGTPLGDSAGGLKDAVGALQLYVNHCAFVVWAS